VRNSQSGSRRTFRGRLTRGRTRRDAGCRARRPSRLDLSKTHGVTPLATRSRRRHVSRGKRRAAQPAARLNASRGLTSRPLGGRAEHVMRSVRIASAIGTTRDASASVLAMSRQQNHQVCRRRFGKFCAQLTLFARHLPVLECWLTAHPRPVPGQGRSELRLRVVVCTSSASKRRICRERILRTGKTQSPRLRHRGSATGVAGQEVPRTRAK
jgi:hypothetical protein